MQIPYTALITGSITFSDNTQSIRPLAYPGRGVAGNVVGSRSTRVKRLASQEEVHISITIELGSD